jgi:hypothetical protein
MDRRDLPLRHAGSFGFDFGAAEWSRDRIRDRYVVRIAAADLPTSLWDEVVAAVAVWWRAHEGLGQAQRAKCCKGYGGQLRTFSRIE